MIPIRSSELNMDHLPGNPQSPKTLCTVSPKMREATQTKLMGAILYERLVGIEIILISMRDLRNIDLIAQFLQRGMRLSSLSS